MKQAPGIQDKDIKDSIDTSSDSDDDDSTTQSTKKTPGVNQKSKKIKKSLIYTDLIPPRKPVGKGWRKARTDVNIESVYYIDYPHRRPKTGRIKKPFQVNMRYRDKDGTLIKSNIAFATARNITPEQIGHYKGSIHTPAWWEHNFAPLPEKQKEEFYMDMRRDLGLDRPEEDQAKLYEDFARRYS